jgi:hypothetical protein
MSDHTWTVRVRTAGDQEVVVHSGKHSIRVGKPVSFQPDEPLLTALELFLAAFAADIVGGFQRVMKARRIPIDAVEFSVNCTLNNPLTHIGVVGEKGNPGVKSLEGTLYVTGDFDDASLNLIWNEVLARSPLACTLAPVMNLRLRTV